jgi:PAS domain S-box-containing protein
MGQRVEAGLLDAIFSHAPVGLAYWDAELRYQRVNPALAAMNGATPDAHIGKRPSEVIGVLGERVEELLTQVLETQEAITGLSISGETPAEPGVRHEFQASYYPITARSGARGVAAVINDVTAERHASEQAQQARRQARTASRLIDAVFETAPVGLAFWTPDLRFRRVNEAFASFTGRPLEAHIDRPLDEVIGPSAGTVRPLVAQVMAEREPLMDHRLAGPSATDGGVGYWEASFFPVLGANGEVEGAAAVLRDVTARHAEEAERERLLKEAVIARAQAEAAQARAEIAQRDAEEARAAVDAAYRRADFLSVAGRRMASSLDYTETLQKVASAAVPAVADWCSITLVQRDGSLETVAVAHGDRDKTRWARALYDRYPPRRDAPYGSALAIRTGEMQLLENLTDESLIQGVPDEEIREILRELAPRSLLVVPLLTSDGVVGAIALVMAESGRRFTDQDAALARSLAARAALHIRNAQLFTERSEIARTLQSNLLPRRLPRIPGLEIAARYHAAGNQNQVGGDFYDVFLGGDGVWTALIGDVAGKGAGAAAVTSLTRYTLRAAAMRSSDPVDNLRLLNDALLSDAAVTRFCTVIYARLCLEDDKTTVTFASGGHLPPMLLHRDGSVDAIDVNGTLIGAVPEPQITTTDTVLRPGELLLMYTDGVTEIRRKDLNAGERQLREVLSRLAGAPAETVVTEVRDAAVAMHDGNPRDDMAVLALRVP